MHDRTAVTENRMARGQRTLLTVAIAATLAAGSQMSLAHSTTLAGRHGHVAAQAVSATFTAANTQDSGIGSLRQTINGAHEFSATSSVAGPQITTDPGSAAFVAGDNTVSTPIVVAGGLSVTDDTSTTLASATVVITGNFHAGEDVLAFVNDGATMGNIAASYDAGTGVMTLTSTAAAATLAQWQSALNSVTYTDTAITPDTATRTVSFTAVDGGGTTGNTATRTIAVTATNQTPIVISTGGTTSYVGGTAAVTIDGGITVSDLDNPTQSSATVLIGAGFHNDGDALGLINDGATMGNIGASYNALSGVMALSSAGATATDAQWSNALSSVTFSSTSTTHGNRTIAFATNDGNKTSAAATATVNVVGLPTVMDVSSTTPDGNYKVGDTISLTVAFDQAVTVDTTGGTPTLLMETGSVDHNATYVSGSGSDTLAFDYTVQVGDTSADLDYASTSALALNSASIRRDGLVADDAVLALPATGSATSVAGQHAIVVDGITPAVVSVDVPANGTYIVGQNLDFTVNYSETVSVDTGGGVPRIAVTLDTGGTVYADYLAGAGSSALTFRYTVSAGVADANGIILATAINTDGGGIHDAAANAATLALNAVGSTTAVLVDGIVPTASIVVADTSLAIGETSLVTITFSEAVGGFSNADLSVTNGTLGAVSSTNGGITWSATFTPTAGISDASNMITLDNTGVTDASGNTGTGITDSNNYAIDTSAPAITSVDVPANGTYVAGQNLDFTVNYDEAVSVDTSGGAPRLLLTIGTATVYADYVSATGTSTLHFTYTVLATNHDGNGIDMDGNLVMNGATLRDAVDNDAATALGPLPSLAKVLVNALPPHVAVPAGGVPSWLLAALSLLAAGLLRLSPRRSRRPR